MGDTMERWTSHCELVQSSGCHYPHHSSACVGGQRLWACHSVVELHVQRLARDWWTAWLPGWQELKPGSEMSCLLFPLLPWQYSVISLVANRLLCCIPRSHLHSIIWDKREKQEALLKKPRCSLLSPHLSPPRPKFWLQWRLGVRSQKEPGLNRWNETELWWILNSRELVNRPRVL